MLPLGSFVNIQKANPIFKPWSGAKIDDSYGNKMVLNFYGHPDFAELGILRMMERSGWNGVWIDTYRNKFRTQYWPKNEVQLPLEQETLFRQIQEVAGCTAGCFDVFCWKGNEFMFIEAKRSRKDKIRMTQRAWLQAAINQCRVPLPSLLIVEWDLP